MKRFSFSLQKLLDLRDFREKQAEIELGKAIAARDAIQLEIEDVARRRVSSAAERTPSAPVRDLLAIEHYIRRLDFKKDELLENLVSAELVLEKKRELYMEATRERQILTKLREKKAESWKKGYLNEEAAILDDIANSRSRAES
jgi:flagellar FliJ protein